MSTHFSKNMESEIEKILDCRVRPMLKRHRGNVDFVTFKKGVLRLRLTGACRGCPLSTLTLKEGVEAILKENLNGIDRVEAVD